MSESFRCACARAAGLLPVLLLVTVVPALAALAVGLVALLWRRRARVAASDAFLGKLAASVLDGGGGGASPRAGRGRSLRAPRGSLADSLASEARRARASLRPPRPCAPRPPCTLFLAGQRAPAALARGRAAAGGEPARWTAIGQLRAARAFVPLGRP